MSEFCSLCGNIHNNQNFKSGVICSDCLSVIRSLNLPAESILIRSSGGLRESRGTLRQR